MTTSIRLKTHMISAGGSPWLGSAGPTSGSFLPQFRSVLSRPHSPGISAASLSDSASSIAQSASYTSFLGRSTSPPTYTTSSASFCSRLVSSFCTESSLISMTTFPFDTGLVTLYSTTSLQDHLHEVLVSFLEELYPAILKFCRFFGGRVDVFVSFTGTSGAGVGICMTVFDRNAASLGEARVGG
ncbi:hypothetical protein PIB30_030844 [Stylosanthes scabra]|uniref:Uncharacterized protein n=1 Tax=Stylosanthes scabra TaxID=79078 RepID=A0ABU6UAG3_9FABA|nr:hypothetical protein [Stylosanthes scabra]